MMNENLVILAGRITRDIKLSYTPQQTAIAEIGLAVNEKYTTKSGEKKENTCFVDCVAFAKTAEILNQYLKKGDPLYIRGKLQFDSWQAQDGTKRSKHRVTITGFQFLGGGQQSEPKQPEYQDNNSDEVPF